MIFLLHLLHSPANNQESSRALPERLRVLLHEFVLNREYAVGYMANHLPPEEAQDPSLRSERSVRRRAWQEDSHTASAPLSYLREVDLNEWALFTEPFIFSQTQTVVDMPSRPFFKKSMKAFVWLSLHEYTRSYSKANNNYISYNISRSLFFVSASFCVCSTLANIFGHTKSKSTWNYIFHPITEIMAQCYSAALHADHCFQLLPVFTCSHAAFTTWKGISEALHKINLHIRN